jgi:hypothetical protein
MLIMGEGVAQNELEGAAWLIACDPKDDEELRKSIDFFLEKVPADVRTKAKVVAEEIKKLF